MHTGQVENDGNGESGVTTLTPTMNFMALLKAGVVIELPDRRIRILKENGRIVVNRKEYACWVNRADFPVTKVGLKEAVSYINLPF